MISKTKKHYFFMRNILDCLKFIKQNRNYIYFSIILFSFFLLIALFLPIPNQIEEALKKILEELLIKTSGLSGVGLTAFIFKNNLTASIIGLFGGLFFGIIPVILIVSNGYVIGYVIKSLILHLGILQGTLSLWKLLPHGIFELPAVFISIGIGLRLGFSLMSALNNRDFIILWQDLKSSIQVLFFIVIPLLFLAAIIEGSLMSLLG